MFRTRTLLLALVLSGGVALAGCAKGNKDLGESCRGNVDAKDNTDCKKGLVCGASLINCRPGAGAQICDRGPYQCMPCGEFNTEPFPTCRAGASRSPLAVIE